VTLTAAEHRQVLAATKRARNAAARARRRAPPLLLRVELLDGTVILASSSRTAPGTAYQLLEGSPDRWRCACRGYAHRGTCSHLEGLGFPISGRTGRPT
jgi:hypothetical protein